MDGVEGADLATRVQENRDVPDTPSLARLLELAIDNPPPPHWLDGDEEDLFS